jgi:hypothetical protein
VDCNYNFLFSEDRKNEVKKEMKQEKLMEMERIVSFNA